MTCTCGNMQCFVCFKDINDVKYNHFAGRHEPPGSTKCPMFDDTVERIRREVAEAHEAAARLLEHDPRFTISAWIARGGQSNSNLMIEGLRKAGLPE